MEKEITKDGTFECPKCHSHNTYGITRVTGYFGKTSMFNKGKLGELADRNREINSSYFKNEISENLPN